MRDLLPPESRARRQVSEQLQRVFERYGYELVTTPLFERVEVFERGLTLDPRDLVRFVEPDTGDVAALRPDITPQIARVVSTRLADLPAPWRIRYEGTVIRRRRGRARRQRQISQVGIELIGLPNGEADLEVVRLAAEACEAAGLSRYRIELSEVGVGRTLLRDLDAAAQLEAAKALARKDEPLLLHILERAGLDSKARARLGKLAHLHGDLGVLKEAQALVKGSAAETHLASLERVAEQLVALGLGPSLGFDLGEIRGAGYYTGVSFALFAPGPGESVASGGRYDQLLERYGAAQPATGAGIDLENLLWALDHAGHPWRDRPSVRFVVMGSEAIATTVRERLHQQGLVAAMLPQGDRAQAEAYARAWNYDALVIAKESPVTAIRSRDGEQRELAALDDNDIQRLCQWAQASSGE
jgi:ATP phosphoribosyltransferase regulatory subunit